ncbi:hypothetical protein [Sediminitomix flava]|nr:hypothetical protein [Sediminitomix flava]
MQELEPFYGWMKHYNSNSDPHSPFYLKEYETDYYTNTIYGYYIHPLWDFIGSETLYIKILYTNYQQGVVVIELFGEWNDTLHNDIMYLKREIVDRLLPYEITKFILIGENIFNFHGSDDCYYEEWFDDVEDGWIAALNFRDFVIEEMEHFNIDNYINFGGSLNIENWRTMPPLRLCQLVNERITYRLGSSHL